MNRLFSTQIFRRNWLLVLISLIIFLTPITFLINQWGYNPFTLTKIALFRSLVIITLFFYIVKVFLKKEFKVKADQWLFFFLLLLVASWGAATYFSIHPFVSFWGSHAKQFGFFSLFFYGLFFLLVFLIVEKWRQIEKILWSVYFSSLVVVGYGFLQYLALDPFSWQEPPFITGRIFSTLGQPNFLAHFLVMVIPLTVFGVIFIVKRSWQRIFLAVLVLFQVLALVLTLSRGGWLALIATGVVFLLGYCVIKKKKKWLWVILITSLFLVTTLAGFNLTDLGKTIQDNTENKIVKRVTSLANLTQGSAGARLNYWQAGWTEFKQASLKRKIFGFGPDTLTTVFAGDYKKNWGHLEALNTIPDRAHNLVLDIWMQFGLAGIIASLLFFGFLFWQSLVYLKDHRQNRDKQYWLVFVLLIVWCGYAINNIVSFSNVTTYVYFYLILGILAGIIFFRKQRVVRLKISLFSKIVLILGCALSFSVIIFYYNINWVRGDIYFMRAQKAVARGRNLVSCPAIINNIDQARSLYPYNIFYKKKYIRETSKCFSHFLMQKDSVEKNLLSVIDSVPQRERTYRFRLQLAHAYRRLGKHEEKYYNKADNVYKELVRFNPELTLPYKRWAESKLQQDQNQEAIEIAERAEQFLPFSENCIHQQKVKKRRADFYNVIARAYKKLNKNSKAIKYYKRAVELNPLKLKYFSEIAKFYEEREKWDKAAEYFRRGYKLSSEDYFWPLRLALVYYQKGDQKQALRYAQEALNLSPDNEDIRKVIQNIKE